MVRGDVSPLCLKDCRVCSAYELWCTCGHTGAANVAGKTPSGTDFLAAFAVGVAPGRHLGVTTMQTWQGNGLALRERERKWPSAFPVRYDATRAGTEMALSVPGAVKRDVIG